MMNHVHHFSCRVVPFAIVEIFNPPAGCYKILERTDLIGQRSCWSNGLKQSVHPISDNASKSFNLPVGTETKHDQVIKGKMTEKRFFFFFPVYSTSSSAEIKMKARKRRGKEEEKKRKRRGKEEETNTSK